MKKKESAGGLRSKLDEVFVVSGEMIKDNGEDDHYAYVGQKFGIVGVFDGCGGIGSRKYEMYENKTGAYIASHMSAETVEAWFDKFCEGGAELSGNTAADICADLHDSLADTLGEIEKTSGGRGAIKGSLVRSFPTTASMILFTLKDKKVYSLYVWAGDSRGYILTPDGLTQITRDDIDAGEDALSNLSSDSRLTNLVHAGGDFKLNSKIISFSGPAVLISATDGCFGYFSTPMEFEYMLLEALSKAKSMDGWKKLIDGGIREYTGDDYTLAAAVLGYGDFRTFKRSFARRRTELYEKYISRLDSADKEELWEEYRTVYYGEAR